MNERSKAIYEMNVDDFGHLDPVQIMGLTVYGESRGESRAGRIAVATVIMERVEHRTWDGKSIEEVCLWPYQFSCFLPNDSNRIMLKRIADDWDYHFSIDRDLFTCFYVAKGISDGTIFRDQDLQKVHCCQYLNPKIAQKTRSKWLAAGMRSIKVIGGHEFFAEV